MARTAREDGSPAYEQALSSAAYDMVTALRDIDDPDARRRAARGVLGWLTDVYGRDAVRDLAEVLADRLASVVPDPTAADPARTTPRWTDPNR
ncbi:hypothetical protein [Pseudonocardia sp.]|jgi:hypothetical protein|uniref:hypothetical protein n=1 Tax=Pseudonocardia sp. TaxID=60912 RepID=UPI003D0E0283